MTGLKTDDKDGVDGINGINVINHRDFHALAASHDILAIGMRADDARRARHGVRTTFVRVASVDWTPSAPLVWPPAAGEIRIVGRPESRAAALQRAREVAAASNGTPVSAFSLADLEALAVAESITLRALLE